jgi:hypothetical protein
MSWETHACHTAAATWRGARKDMKLHGMDNEEHYWYQIEHF